jgi:hypothetical protein
LLREAVEPDLIVTRVRIRPKFSRKLAEREELLGRCAASSRATLGITGASRRRPASLREAVELTLLFLGFESLLWDAATKNGGERGINTPAQVIVSRSVIRRFEYSYQQIALRT